MSYCGYNPESRTRCSRLFGIFIEILLVLLILVLVMALMGPSIKGRTSTYEAGLPQLHITYESASCLVSRCGLDSHGGAALCRGELLAPY